MHALHCCMVILYPTRRAEKSFHDRDASAERPWRVGLWWTAGSSFVRRAEFYGDSKDVGWRRHVRSERWDVVLVSPSGCASAITPLTSFVLLFACRSTRSIAGNMLLHVATSVGYSIQAVSHRRSEVGPFKPALLFENLITNHPK